MIMIVVIGTINYQPDHNDQHQHSLALSTINYRHHQAVTAMKGHDPQSGESGIRALPLNFNLLPTIH
jgi:hypothetical protein